MIPEIGQRCGPYEILGKLGGGGMGLVLHAWDERLHRHVAIKLLHDDYTMPGMRERFLQEARAASALNHPNICTVFDIGEQDRNPYLVMELLQGETVKDRILHGALPAEEIIRYGIEIADALGAANAKGIVHRDIKPANIFLVKMPNGKYQTKVLDFGLAKIELKAHGGWESRSLDLTLAGATVGTLSYMSPEQARGEPLDVRSDLFSLGVVLYEMATRQVPFKGITSALMFVQLFSHDPEPVHNWNDAIPREMEKVILKLLAKDRKRRFQTAKELQDALAKVGGKLGRGGWLGKTADTPVPLVRASDPVAWHRGGRQSQIAGRDSSGGTGAGHSMHSTRLGLSRVEAASMRMMRQGAVAVESGDTPAQGHSLHDIAIAGRSAVAASRTDLMLERRWQEEVRFDDDSENADSKGLLIVDVVEEDVVEELIAASSAIEARTQVRMVGVAALILAGVVAVSLVFSGVFRPLVLGTNDHLLLTVIENKTGDKTLDGTVMQGLEIALRQSQTLNVLGGEAYQAGLKQIEVEGSTSSETVPEQGVAQNVGARAYLYGEIEGTAPYTIHIDVLKTDSNDKVETLEETAASRADIPTAVGRMAQDIRIELSDDGRSEIKKSVPLDREATASVDALHAYALGEAAMQHGRSVDALAAYRRSVEIDPKFVQAQMRLAWLYGAEKAEIASAEAAEAALSSSAKSSGKVKLLAQFCYEINASGNYGSAMQIIQRYVARYPLDRDGKVGLARLLRMEGNFSDALRAAQQGYADNPFDAEMYGEAELAMIAMDRYDGALQLTTQAARVGVAPSGDALIAGFLAGREDVVAAQVSAIQSGAEGTAIGGGSKSYADLYRYGLYLDNTGRAEEGLELWRAAAAKASGVPGLASTQAAMLAQGALDRALTESCSVALELVGETKTLPKGPVATFNVGMAAALCGDQPYAERMIVALQQSYPQSTAVTQYYVPELRAAGEIGVNEPEKALDSLIALEPYDQISLAPYLRGMTNEALGQMAGASLDFQTVLDHQGASLMFGSNIYPMAEVGVARANSANRDKATGVEAYGRFLRLWGAADQGQALVREAVVRSGNSQPGHAKAFNKGR